MVVYYTVNIVSLCVYTRILLFICFTLVSANPKLLVYPLPRSSLYHGPFLPPSWLMAALGDARMEDAAELILVS